jgi:hypothetical protein
MAGLATDTMVVSSRIMKNPTTRAHSAGQGDAVGCAGSACCGVIAFLSGGAGSARTGTMLVATQRR